MTPILVAFRSHDGKDDLYIDPRDIKAIVTNTPAARLTRCHYQEQTMSTRILMGDAREQLATLPNASVHCCVTSPPYYGLRDYGVDGQMGLEETPDAYVANLVAVFREVRRVLRDDGTLWLNIGDSYAGSGKGRNADGTHQEGGKQGTNKGTVVGSLVKTIAPDCKPKDLIGIPWRVAFALQADGWYLRQDIIWHKPNPMPESVRDRCTKSHEYMFLFAKSKRYYFDSGAMKEEANPKWKSRYASPFNVGTKEVAGQGRPNNASNTPGIEQYTGKRNKRSVWSVTTKPYKGAHFAVFPPALVEPCIKAGSSEFGVCAGCGTPFRRIVAKTRVPTRPGTDSVKSPDPQRHVTTSATTGFVPGCRCVDTGHVAATVLDPFAGSGTTGQVAKSLGRDSILIELNPKYLPLIEARVAS